MSTPLTWNDQLSKAEQQLADAGVEDARTNAEYILAHALGLNHRRAVRTILTERAWKEEKRIFYRLIDRRIAREPLQYILGEWEFYGLPITLNSHVLIPRPETELLVEQALRESAFFQKKVSILDIGTGSGCIALALAHHLVRAKVVGIDVSGLAILLARKNAKQLKIRNVHFRQSDLFSMRWNGPGYRFDLIVANPPYISRKEFETLEPELRLYEPSTALTDNADGLTFYRRLAEIVPAMLRKKGSLLVELGYGMEEAVREIMLRAGLNVLRVENDLAGIPRVMVAAVNN